MSGSHVLTESVKDLKVTTLKRRHNDNLTTTPSSQIPEDKTVDTETVKENYNLIVCQINDVNICKESVFTVEYKCVFGHIFYTYCRNKYYQF